MSCSVLVVDDEASVRKSIGTYLSTKNYDVRMAGSADEGLREIQRDPPHVTLLDLKMPDKDGFYLLEEGQDRLATSAVIVFSGYANIEKAVRATKLGADEVLEKPLSPSELEKKIRAKLPTEPQLPADAAVLPLKESGIDLVTASEPMQRVREQILLASRNNNTTVLIQGESGTGKELVAKAIWEKSPGESNQLVDVNCAALSKSLLEAELFGHEEGAFTGAQKSRKGLFEAADEGVIFLDEIGEMPLDLQPKLLRVLEERKFKRVGGTKNVETDFRVVASTNRQLAQMVEDGKFRRDLFYRLNVFTIHLPPLRQRLEDVGPLARRMLWSFTEQYNRKLDGFTPESLRKLKSHSWPGNVRELRNVVERAAMLATHDQVAAEDIVFAKCPANHDHDMPLECQSIREMEEKLILRVLEENDWQKARSAEILGINRTTLWQKIKRYGLEKEDK